MMESIEKLRKALKDCTKEAGIEPCKFDTYWITAKACDMLIDEIEAEIESRYMELPEDRRDAESTYRDYEGDWARDYEMLRDIATMTHYTEDELAESWNETRREWAVRKLMEVRDD